MNNKGKIMLAVFVIIIASTVLVFSAKSIAVQNSAGSVNNVDAKPTLSCSSGGCTASGCSCQGKCDCSEDGGSCGCGGKCSAGASCGCGAN